MKKIIFFVAFLLTNALHSQIVNIPDINFKNALLNEPVWDVDCIGHYTENVDVNNDGEIQLSEAQGVICLRVSGFNIESMEGIQSFSNLRILNCNVNQISDLDVSQNLALEVLDCQTNLIEDLNVANNENLDRLLCYNNLLTSLDVTQNNNLRTLSCSINQLTSIDVSQNPELRMFSCNINQIDKINVSNNPNLVSLLCYDNQLTTLNIKNENNTSLAFFQAEENPNLLCIEVDDEVYANANTVWVKDVTTVYSEDCSLGVSSSEKLSPVVYPSPIREILYIESLEKIESIWVYSMLGKLLSLENKNNQIDLSALPTGVYLVEIETNKGSIVQKILKE